MPCITSSHVNFNNRINKIKGIEFNKNKDTDNNVPMPLVRLFPNLNDVKYNIIMKYSSFLYKYEIKCCLEC